MDDRLKPSAIVCLLMTCLASGFMAGLFLSGASAVADNSLGGPFMCDGSNTGSDSQSGRYQFYCHPRLEDEYGIIDTQTGLVIRMKNLSYEAIVKKAVSKAQLEIIQKNGSMPDKILGDKNKMEIIFDEINNQRFLFGIDPLPADSATLMSLIKQKYR